MSASTFTATELADLRTVDARIDADADRTVQRHARCITVSGERRTERRSGHIRWMPDSAGNRDPALARVVGELVRQRREAGAMPLPTLATLVGVHRTTVARIESGVRLPSLPMLVDLALALGCEAGQLLPGRNK